MIFLILTTVFIFLLAGAFLVLYVNSYNKRKKRHIEEKHDLQKKFEDELVKTQMEVQEHTLKTIAAEIHDNVGQLLSLSKLTLGTVNVATDPEKADQKIHNALGLLDTSIKELRQLSSVLYAENLLAGGFENAVENELHWIARAGLFRVDLEFWGNNNIEIDTKKALIAFRMIQELLNNIVKHSNCSTISVCFEYREKDVVIKVQDDGMGFKVSHVIAQPSGLGLITLFKRAKMIGGELILTSESGVGTTAQLIFPY